MIIGELDFGHVQAFAAIQLLFVLQNVVVEEFLKLLVAVINAKLLKGINGEVFCKGITISDGEMAAPEAARHLTETSNIQDTDVIRGGFKWNTLIDIMNDVIEEAAVQGLCQGIPSAIRLAHFQRDPGNGKEFNVNVSPSN